MLLKFDVPVTLLPARGARLGLKHRLDDAGEALRGLGELGLVKRAE
jgi:hypothetical protein